MRLMRNLNGWSRGIYATERRCVMILLVLLVAGSLAIAQEEVGDISASGLLTKAQKSLSSADYSAAIPYLTEYLKRMSGGEEPRVLALSQDVRLKLAKLMAHQSDPTSAVDYLKQYTTHLPLYKPREAYKLMAVNFYEIGEFEACISAATNALANPLPQGLKENKKTVDYETLSKKERGGFTDRQLKRIEKAVEKAGGDLSEGVSEQAPDPEPDYTAADLVLLNITLADAYVALEMWEESLEPYRFVIANVEQDERKGYAIMKMVNSLVALERFEEVKTLVVQLCRTNARYDIRVNVAMMDAAAALFDAKKYDSALILYRMVLPREDLMAYQEIKMNEIRRETGLPEVNVTIITNAAGRIETLFEYKSAAMNIRSDGLSTAVDLSPKPPKLIQLEEAVSMLAGLPAYENEVLFRIGLLYAKVGRPWEAVTALALLTVRDSESALGQRAFAEFLLVLVDPLKKYQQVETHGRKFLETHIEGLGPRMVAYALTASFQKQERWVDIKKLAPVIEGFIASKEDAVRQYEGELFYMQAIADMVLLNYPEAQRGFEKILTDYPDQEQKNAFFWHAMTLLFQQKYQEAYDEFEAYPAKFRDKDEDRLSEVLFRGGICLFSMEKYNLAKERFTAVIKTYPKSEVFADACSLRGDLYAAESGGFDEAIQDYRTAIDAARKVGQATYAVFQMATLLEANASLNKDYLKEIVKVVTAYLDNYEEKADVAKAVYWIGKTKVAQGLMDEAVTMYLDAIVKYGGDVKQDGVDSIISDLAKLSKSLSTSEIQSLQIRLKDEVSTADNETLKLRLRVLIAKMDRTEIELGKALIVEQEDLTKVPPPVLALICEASFESGNYSRAQDILKIFQSNFDESDFMRSAYKLRAYDLFAANEASGALKIIQEAQALYGRESDMAWAQVMKGRIQLGRQENDAARETFNDVLRERAWRGEPFAQATFYLGSTEEASGNLKLAFAMYQRVYVQYKGYAKGYWAAEGYLASARCLQKLGLENDRRNTFRALLFDKYVNTLPQAEVAKKELGATEVEEINTLLTSGIQSNITVDVEVEVDK